MKRFNIKITILRFLLEYLVTIRCLWESIKKETLRMK